MHLMAQKGYMELNSARLSNPFPPARTVSNAVLASAQHIGWSATISLPQGISSFVNILSLQAQNTSHNLH